MGATNSNTDGWRIVNVDPDGPCARVTRKLTVYFDFIVGVEGHPDLDIASNNDIFEAIQYQMNEKTKLKIYNYRTRKTRSIEVIPTENWSNYAQMGSLGLQIEKANIGDCNEFVQVKSSSGNDQDRLLEVGEFILGLAVDPFITFDSKKKFDEVLDELSEKKKAASIYVFNNDTTKIRTVKLVPTKDGILSDYKFELEQIPEQDRHWSNGYLMFNNRKSVKLSRPSFAGWKNKIKFHIRFDGKVTEVMVKKAGTMKAALDTIYKEMDLANNPDHDFNSCEDITLWNMNYAKDILLQPIVGDLLEIDVEMIDFPVPTYLHMQKNENAETKCVWFKNLQFGKTELLVNDEIRKRNDKIKQQIQKEEKEDKEKKDQFAEFRIDFKDEQIVPVRIAFDKSIADLVKEIKGKTKVESVWYFEDGVLNELKEGNVLIGEHKSLSEGCNLFAGTKTWIKDVKEDLIELKYSLYDLSEKHRSGAYEVKICISKKATIGELRGKLAKEMNVEKNKVILSIALTNQDVTDRQQLQTYGIAKIRSMWVGKKM